MMASISNVIKGTIISFMTTIIFLLIFSVIFTYTNISESFITPTIIVITAISIFIGSTISNSKMQKNGLLNGAIIGGIYLIGIYVISSIINQKFALSMQSIAMIISGMICGMFGGILGVNKSR
mgnify:FL=1